MKFTQVLLLENTSGRCFAVLHDPETHSLLEEDYNTFIYRTLLPHNTRIEVRKIRTIDVVGWGELMNVPYTAPLTDDHLSEVFSELFLIGEGYYSPKTPVPFPPKE